MVSYLGRIRKAHVVAFILTIGKIPPGKIVRHTCDNRLCCNPEHLILGTHAENMADMVARGGRKGIGSGSDNGRSKLTQEQAEEIRAIYAAQKGSRRIDRLSQAAIGEQYGISQHAVSQILMGRRYVAGAGRPAARVDPRTIRALAFARDGGACAVCGEVTPDWHADHIIPIAKKGADSIENTQTLCPLHHALKTATDRIAA